MSTLYSDTDKIIAIRKFIHARSNKNAIIADYSPIREYIATGRITLLCKLAKSGSYTQSSYPYEKVYYYSDADAKTYVEWLISALNDTLDTPVTEEIFKKAVNQLHMFVFSLSGTLKSNVDLLQPYSLDEHLKELKEKILSVDAKVERMNDKIITALERTQRWQKMYEPYLDELKKEHDERNTIEKSLKGTENGKKKDT